MKIDPVFYDAEYGAHLESRPAHDYAFLMYSHHDHDAKFTLAIDQQ